MNWKNRFSEDRGERDGRGRTAAGLGNDSGASLDPDMEKALRHFRLSVHAWSDAVYRLPRLEKAAPRRMAWRRAAAWALGSVLVAGGAGGGLLGYRHQQEHARIAAVREAEKQRQLQEQRAREAEQELARVDADVSREVPAALEPLGQLMITGESR